MSADLVLTWGGGNPGDGIVLALIALRPKPDSGSWGRFGPHRDGRVGPGGPPDGPRGPADMLPPDSTRSIIVKLDSNPGTYTIPASRLQALITATAAQDLLCLVMQLTENRVEHDGGTVRVVLRDEDRVRLRVQ